jgi:uncharacterized membrane protein
MYFSRRSIQVRHISLSIVNASITLVILLIAPLGIMAVLINTALVGFATYVTGMVGDRVILYLQEDSRRAIEDRYPTALRRVDDRHRQ